MQGLEYNQSFSEPGNNLQLYLEEQVLNILNYQSDACPLHNLDIKLEPYDTEGFFTHTISLFQDKIHIN